MKWEPIETAPKGRNILLFAVTNIGIAGNWRMATGHQPYDGGRWTWDGRLVMDWEAQPTHWMPLPEPPQVKRQDEEATLVADEPSQSIRQMPDTKIEDPASDAVEFEKIVP